jgi:transmembrane sensor
LAIVNDHRETVETLITKYLSGEASAEESKQLRLWIAERPENEAHFNAAKKIFDVTSAHYAAYDSASPIDIDAEWIRFKSEIGVQEKSKVIPINRPQAAPVWMKVAATLLVILVSGFVILWFLQKNSDSVFKTDAATMSVKLPDGSGIILNKHSEVSWSRSFGKKERKIMLKGEAFFDVVHDTSKPFIVESENTTVEDVGTSFNIRSLPHGDGVEVTVQSGVVKFSVASIGKQIELTAGHVGSFTKETKQLEGKTNTDINFMSWNTQKIIFTEANLKTVVETLNKTYQSNITISGTVPTSCVVTVTFDHQSLESALDVLETTLNLTIKVSGDQILITRVGC